ncbi:MAG: PKD domain-containing protein [Myxococcales bacterium]|nr:PKD domain-containing protein [Myxococcales bacterium]
MLTRNTQRSLARALPWALLLLAAAAACTSRRGVDTPREPVASLEGPSVGRTGEALTFDGSLSVDPDGRIRYWIFQIDQRQPRYVQGQPRFQFVFRQPGVYSVTLTVRDEGGNEASDTLTVTISGEPIGPASDTETSLDVSGSDGTTPVADAVLMDITLGDWIAPNDLSSGSDLIAADAQPLDAGSVDLEGPLDLGPGCGNLNGLWSVEIVCGGDVLLKTQTGLTFVKCRATFLGLGDIRVDMNGVARITSLFLEGLGVPTCEGALQSVQQLDLPCGDTCEIHATR